MRRKGISHRGAPKARVKYGHERNRDMEGDRDSPGTTGTGQQLNQDDIIFVNHI